MDPVSFTQATPPSLWKGESVAPLSSAEIPVSSSPIFQMPFVEGQNTVFEIGNQTIAANGGVTDPAALIRAQVQVLAAEMSWIFTAQIANKASSGVQTLFNNQV